MFIDDPRPISGAQLVRALERAGFVVFRRHAIATLLERGLRAVAVPNQSSLPPQAIRSVRQMSGLTAGELDDLLRDLASASSGGPPTRQSGRPVREASPGNRPDRC